MPLTSFGSILNFAETLEKQDEAFYAQVTENQVFEDLQDLFSQFLKDARKNIKNVQRARRENVTEMILEPITGFTRAPFCEEINPSEAKTNKEILEASACLEKRAERYYNEASSKIKALPEVARVLKTIGKKHTAHLKKLEAL